MDIRTRADYDHGPNEVFAVLTDPDFVAAKALMQQIRQALSSGSTLDLPTE